MFADLTWEDAEYYKSSGKCKLKPQWDVTSDLSECKQIMLVRIWRSGNPCILLCTVYSVQCKLVHSHGKQHEGFSKKLKIELPYDPEFGEGNGTPLQYSCLENPMDGGTWWAAVCGIAKSRTRLNDFTSLFTFLHRRRKWQPTPVFLRGESQGPGSLVGCHLWGHTESDTTDVT